MYVYAEERVTLVEGGVSSMVKLLAVSEAARKMVKCSGAFTARHLIEKGGIGGDSFQTLACLDFLCEYGYLYKIDPSDGGTYKAGSLWG